jgi:hypothetical protein
VELVVIFHAAARSSSRERTELVEHWRLSLRVAAAAACGCAAGPTFLLEVRQDVLHGVCTPGATAASSPVGLHDAGVRVDALGEVHHPTSSGSARRRAAGLLVDRGSPPPSHTSKCHFQRFIEIYPSVETWRSWTYIQESRVQIPIRDTFEDDHVWMNCWGFCFLTASQENCQVVVVFY